MDHGIDTIPTVERKPAAMGNRSECDEVCGERHMERIGDVGGWDCIRMVLRTRTWLPLRGYLALRGVGGTLSRRLKRIGWRLDLTKPAKPQHTTPTYHFTRSCSYACS